MSDEESRRTLDEASKLRDKLIKDGKVLDTPGKHRR